MRTAQKLLLLAVTAIAAFALAVPAASAQSTATLEVNDEATGDPCPEVTISGHTPGGGCEIGAATEPNSTADINFHVPGLGELLQSECENHFEAVIQHTGHGYVYNQGLEGGDECGLVPCEETGAIKEPWPFHLYEENGDEGLAITFCVSRDGVDTHCTIAIPFQETENVHEYEFLTSAPGQAQPPNLNSSSRCSEQAGLSLTGHWVTNLNHSEVEITHEELL